MYIQFYLEEEEKVKQDTKTSKYLVADQNPIYDILKK